MLASQGELSNSHCASLSPLKTQQAALGSIGDLGGIGSRGVGLFVLDLYIFLFLMSSGHMACGLSDQIQRLLG